MTVARVSQDIFHPVTARGACRHCQLQPPWLARFYGSQPNPQSKSTIRNCCIAPFCDRPRSDTSVMDPTPSRVRSICTFVTFESAFRSALIYRGKCIEDIPTPIPWHGFVPDPQTFCPRTGGRRSMAELRSHSKPHLRRSNARSRWPGGTHRITFRSQLQPHTRQLYRQEALCHRDQRLGTGAGLALEGRRHGHTERD